MKKKLLITSIILTLSIMVFVAFNNNINKNKNNIISNITKEEHVINSNMITMMYETEAGSGEYTETADNTWPESGYIFNDTLSGCENGGELEYNSQNNTVNLLSNSSDRCYVYFDKYDGVWIDNVSITNVTGSSITLSVDATSENGSISKYYYALNDSEEYIESTTNPIVINDLNKLTEYKISIYAIDSTNAKSNIYKISVNTTDESKPVINSVSVSDITNNSFTLTVNASSEVGISKYYYTIDSYDIAGISSNDVYVFDDLSRGTTYNVSIYVKDINGILSNVYELSVQTEDMNFFADWIIEQYGGIQGNNGIYHHQNLANSAEDDSYRYSGANPNNYVCFGSDAAICPSENLYRIIGVFDEQVKLIKNTSIGSYVWDSSGNNIWSSSTLNNLLNTTYLNSFEELWREKISSYSWKVGGVTVDNMNVIPEIAHVYEVGILSISTLQKAKIGLMYATDYGFATDNTYWLDNLNDTWSNAKNNNWLYLKSTEWTITRTLNTTGAFRLDSSGYVGYDYSTGFSHDVRPTFYLNADVKYISGSGTSSAPIRIQ